MKYQVIYADPPWAYLWGLGHSVKPPVVRERIEKLFGNVSRIELFARQRANGWDSIGYGIDGTSIEDKIKQINNAYNA
ncbi:MAG: MT-A70 family methyltransferase [Treponema sp.]|nr:MT-A70 family methyltransferase [Treponema sp.]